MINYGISGIYKITNKINGKLYVGQSKNIRVRWNMHRSELLRNIHPNAHLQSTFNLYGIENFSFSIIEINPIDNDRAEEFWINFYNSSNRNFGYNVCGWKNEKRTIHQETRDKLSKRFKGTKRPELSKRRRPHSEEAKRKMSTSRKGQIAWNVGMSGHLSEETKERMSKSHDKNGEKSGTAKLTNEDVLKIVELYANGNSARKLGTQFKVADHTIYDICSGRSWSHITGIPKKSRSKRNFRDRRKKSV